MSPREWLAAGGVLAVLFLGLPLIRAIANRMGAGPEVARKMIHVAMGLVCLTFPWWFERATPVWWLALMATIPLAIVRCVPALRSGVASPLHGINRPSYGEILFAPAVATVFHLARGDRYLFLIPILILTISDAAGALVGTRWGKRHYGSGEGFKTVEGSLIFLGTAFLCAFLPLLLSHRTDWQHALGIGIILGLLAMMAEGLSDRGFDNLLVPVGSFLVLERLMILEVPSLVGRIVVLALLLALVLRGSRWSTLSGAALLGAMLLGYGCAVIATWQFALPPAAVFVCHIVTTRKHDLLGKFDHRLDAVLSHAIGCLPWVLGFAFQIVSPPEALAGISFAMAAQLALLDTSTRAATCRPALPARATAKGLLIAGLPGLVWLWPSFKTLWIPVVMAAIAAWTITWVFEIIRRRYHGHPTGLWIIKGVLALAASLPAFYLAP